MIYNFAVSFTDLAFGTSDPAFETTFVNDTVITAPAKNSIPEFDCKSGLKNITQCVKGQIMETWIVEQVIAVPKGKPRKVFVRYMYCCKDGSEQPSENPPSEEPPSEEPPSQNPPNEQPSTENPPSENLSTENTPSE